jgi:hypothetical protein
VTARSEAKTLITWTLRRWFRISFKALMFVLVFLCCVVCVSRGLCDGLITRPKECCCLNRLRNIPCEAAKVNTTTVEPLMDGWMDGWMNE